MVKGLHHQKRLYKALALGAKHKLILIWAGIPAVWRVEQLCARVPISHQQSHANTLEWILRNARSLLGWKVLRGYAAWCVTSIHVESVALSTLPTVVISFAAGAETRVRIRGYVQLGYLLKKNVKLFEQKVVTWSFELRELPCIAHAWPGLVQVAVERELRV